MKNLILSCFVAVAAIAFTSCSKDKCYECTQSVGPLSTVQEICNDQVTTSVNGASTGTASLNGVSAEDYKANLEKTGFTCKAK